MANEVITHSDQVSPEWLTYILKESGALTGGQVVVIVIDTNERILSTSARLRIAYSRDSTGPMPRNLFLKIVDADQDEEFFGPSEVLYYTRDYAGSPCAPIPHCYHAAYSESLRRYHLLLDDLSESHIEAKHKHPTLEYGLALAEGLACLHAHYWGTSKIADVGDRIPEPSQIERFVEVARPGADYIIDAFSGQMKRQWPARIKEILDRHPQAMIERTRDGNGFALIHGDPNWNNILVPRDGVRPLYIIDRQPFDWSLTVWLGVYDLAYAMVLNWEIADRRRYERRLLRHYHYQLIDQGILNYPWERLFDDYRLSVGICIYVAIEWCRGGINETWTHVWLPMLQSALTACDDLNCRQLWT